jgi:hypothetical protein
LSQRPEVTPEPFNGGTLRERCARSLFNWRATFERLVAEDESYALAQAAGAVAVPMISGRPNGGAFGSSVC